MNLDHKAMFVCPNTQFKVQGTGNNQNVSTIGYPPMPFILTQHTTISHSTPLLFITLPTHTIFTTPLTHPHLINTLYPYTSQAPQSMSTISTHPTLKFLSSVVHLMTTISSGCEAEMGPQGMSKSRMFWSASLNFAIMSAGICGSKGIN